MAEFKVLEDEPFHQKFKKPGKKEKKAKILNRKVRQHDIPVPEEKHCRLCGIETGTEALRHYEGVFKHLWGKGVGLKVNDNLVSWLCYECDKRLSTPLPKDVPDLEKYHREVNWLKTIIETKLL
jgi:hypothetical protein